MNTQYAGTLRRFLSTIIDQGIYSLLFLLPLPRLAQVQTLSELLTEFIYVLTCWVFLGISGALYPIVLQARFGKTIGMLVSGCKLVDNKGNVLTWKLIFFRQLIALPVSIGFLCIGLLWMIKDKKKQCWHDHLVDSYVIKQGKNMLLVGILTLIVLTVGQMNIVFNTAKNIINNASIQTAIPSIIKEIEDYQIEKDTLLNEDLRPEEEEQILDTETEANTETNDAYKKAAAKQQVATYYWQGFEELYGNQDYRKAGTLFKQALDIDPNYAPALSSYGLIQALFYGKTTEGEAMIRRAIDLDPTWAYGTHDLGLVLFVKGNKAEGIKWVQYTIDTFPQHPDIEGFKQTLANMKNEPNGY